ncbi:AMP-binding protein [Pelolinea submarina]|uniref:Acyl-CoA synthetase (AMP-forming)/AMP-acid ligase II n=1 Tax=Pelolinea submarina TaxID=913107 RepID=A0A347ZT63_9CHLR|nr:AMP-binding protein [Pelolinea submarina]REG10931.1 acyl-CoA synthetase (AMP-forming)/AMP-acid ligase II [Pelolinea submarina]BBB48494.1 fatty-acyl-CoA synthase [Pelolinea submarina]
MDNFSTRLLRLSQENPSKTILNVLQTGQDDIQLTYRDLVQGAGKYTAALVHQNIEPGEVVILILQQSVDLFLSYFGTILNGSVPSIMPFLTEKLLPEKYRKDLVSLIEITRPSAIITYKEFAGELEVIRQENSFIKTVLYVEDIRDLPEEQSIEYRGLQCKEENVVLLQHSSGTTGLQKGVALSHQAVFNQLDIYTQKLQINAQDVIVSWLPLYHDMGLIACFIMPVLYNIPLVIMSPFDWVRAPYRLFQAITGYKGTLCWLPNFAYNFCAQKIRPSDLEGVDLSSLRAVTNCSEPMRFASHQLFLDRFKPYGLRDTAIATCYAMAENVFAVTQDGIEKPVTYDEIDLEILQKDKLAQKASAGERSVIMVSAGKPLENTSVRIVDEQGNELPERHLGEIVLQSNCMLTGYYHREDATQKAMLAGWFKTGDLGYLADGELYISGRKKDLIIVGGKNVYPQDIESVVNEIEGVHPGRNVAFGVFNEERGTEEVIVIAELEPGYEDQSQPISGRIRQQVTQSTAVALRQVYLVNGFWLIKTSSGKIARAANKEKYLAELAQTK